MKSANPGRTILLNPGPVTLSQRVRSAVPGADICHREPEFTQLQEGVRRKLSRVYGTEESFVPLVLTGSGTAAVEAMLQTFCPGDREVLVISNGVYGERMATMLARQGKPRQVCEFGWTEAIDPGILEKRLSERRYAYMLVVHHETTTGRLNNLDNLVALAERFHTPLLVDAVSSFGAESMPTMSDMLVAVAATANKCLHGIPGISFVLCRHELIARASCARSQYLDLKVYAEDQVKGSTPFTQAIPAIFALDAALDEFFEAGGVSARHNLYATRQETVLRSLRALGVQPLLAAGEQQAAAMVSFHTPSWTTYTELHDFLREHGFVIYAGQGGFHGKIFRIAVMGEITEEDLDRLCSLLTALKEQKI